MWYRIRETRQVADPPTNNHNNHQPLLRPRASRNYQPRHAPCAFWPDEESPVYCHRGCGFEIASSISSSMTRPVTKHKPCPGSLDQMRAHRPAIVDLDRASQKAPSRGVVWHAADNITTTHLASHFFTSRGTDALRFRISHKGPIVVSVAAYCSHSVQSEL